MQERLIELFSVFPWQWEIFLLSMLPVTELRATVPLGIAVLEKPPLQVFLLAVLGNVLPLLFLIPLLPLVFRFLYRWQPLCRLVERTRARGQQVERYGALGLLLFVAIPLPGTGAWTGCLLAYLFGISKLHTAVMIPLGVIIAGAIMTLASMGALSLFRMLTDLSCILLLIVLFLCVLYFWRKKR